MIVFFATLSLSVEYLFLERPWSFQDAHMLCGHFTVTLSFICMEPSSQFGSRNLLLPSHPVRS